MLRGPRAQPGGIFADRRLRADRSRLVGELFRSFLERDPEPEALSYYLAELESGYTLKDIVLQILHQPLLAHPVVVGELSHHVCTVLDPVSSEQRRMLPISNVAFARALLPSDDFEFGAFENHFLPGLLNGAQLDDAIVIDHRQHCGFARATMLQFHNARVAGACMRMTYPNAMAGLRRGLREFLLDRVPAVASTIVLHPLKDEIPALTRLRMRWLTVAIAAGYLCGSCFGYGNSPWKLE